jgi:hypothetical protein
MAIEQPRVALNTGFADLGKGFYLTDDRDAARGRAKKRARVVGGTATVSIFELDESKVSWIVWGEGDPVIDGVTAAFGLRFEESPAGYAAWARYIKSCRTGTTEVPRIGSPAIVRAWIATMEVEMVCSGFLDADDFAQVVEPEELIVQYCILDQDVLDGCLTLTEVETIG